MTINPMYLNLYSEQLQKMRLEEAARQRLIRTATLGNPSGVRKIWLILRDRWGNLWNRKRDQKTYTIFPPVPGKSPSM